MKFREFRWAPKPVSAAALVTMLRIAQDPDAWRLCAGIWVASTDATGELRWEELPRQGIHAIALETMLGDVCCDQGRVRAKVVRNGDYRLVFSDTDFPRFEVLEIGPFGEQWGPLHSAHFPLLVHGIPTIQERED